MTPKKHRGTVAKQCQFDNKTAIGLKGVLHRNRNATPKIISHRCIVGKSEHVENLMMQFSCHSDMSAFLAVIL